MTCERQGMHMGLAMFPPAFPMEGCHIPANRVGAKMCCFKGCVHKAMLNQTADQEHAAPGTFVYNWFSQA
jgi:hypothetical protein